MTGVKNKKSKKENNKDKSISFELEFLSRTNSTLTGASPHDLQAVQQDGVDGEQQHVGKDDHSSDSNDNRSCCSSKSSIGSRLRSIRSQILCILVLLFFAMMGLFLAVLLSIFLTSFYKLEKSVMAVSNKRITRVLYERLTRQLAASEDYSEWGDTFDAVESLNNVIIQSQGVNRTTELMDAFLAANFYPDHIQSFHKINFIVFYNMSGYMLNYLGYDLDTMDPLELPQEFAQIPKGHPLDLSTMDYKNDTLRASGGLMMASGRLFRVTNSLIMFPPDYPDPGGMLVYATFVENETKDVSSSVQMCLSYYTRDQFSTDPSVTSIISAKVLNQTSGTQSSLKTGEWLYDEPFRVTPFDAKSAQRLSGRECWHDDDVGSEPTSNPRLASYQVYTDIVGSNVLLVRADVERSINPLGLKSFGWSYGMVCLVVLIISIVVTLFIEFVVVGPVVQLSTSVLSIRQMNDITRRVKIPRGGTEISSLARGVNSMLNALYASQRKLASDHAVLIRLLDKVAVEEQKSRSIMNAMTDFILTVNSETGVILSANQAFYSKLGYSSKNVENSMSISTLLKDLNGETLMDNLSQLADTNSTLDTSVYTSFAVLPVEVSCHTVRLFMDDDNVVNCFVVVVRNMKEQHELMQTLNKHQEQLLQLADQVKFDQMMRNHETRDEFQKFCTSEASEENFLFLQAIEHYKSLKSVHERAIFQHEIVEKFLKPTGIYPLNLAGKLLTTELAVIEKSCGDLTMFDKLETAVRIMVVSDSFVRFVHSIDDK